MIKSMDAEIKKYMAKIGKKGGLTSKRKLDSETAKQMVKVRMAKKAYKQFFNECFWSFSPELIITSKDIKWVGSQLLKHGSMKVWDLGTKLCQ